VGRPGAPGSANRKRDPLGSGCAALTVGEVRRFVGRRFTRPAPTAWSGRAVGMVSPPRRVSGRRHRPTKTCTSTARSVRSGKRTSLSQTLYCVVDALAGPGTYFCACIHERKKGLRAATWPVHNPPHLRSRHLRESHGCGPDRNEYRAWAHAATEFGMPVLTVRMGRDMLTAIMHHATRGGSIEQDEPSASGDTRTKQSFGTIAAARSERFWSKTSPGPRPTTTSTFKPTISEPHTTSPPSATLGGWTYLEGVLDFAVFLCHSISKPVF
jgi:hypothetical protein